MVDLDFVLAALFGLLGIAFFLIVAIMIQRALHTRRQTLSNRVRKKVVSAYFDEAVTFGRIPFKVVFEALIDIDEQMQLDPSVREILLTRVLKPRHIRRMVRRVNSPFVFTRKTAAFYLGRLASKKTDEALFDRFKSESREAVRLYIIIALAPRLTQAQFETIMESLKGSTSFYQRRVGTIIANHYHALYHWFPIFEKSTDEAVIRTLLHVASFNRDAFLNTYSLELLGELTQSAPFKPSINDQFISMIVNNFLDHSPEYLMDTHHLTHPNPVIQRSAILALAKSLKKRSLHRLIDTLDVSAMDDVRIEAINRMVFDQKSLLDEILAKYPALSDYKKRRLTSVLAHRFDYIMLKTKLDNSMLYTLTQNCLEEGWVEPLITFLNQNAQRPIGKEIADIVRPHLSDVSLRKRFAQAANEPLAMLLGLAADTYSDPPREKPPLEPQKVKFILRWVMVSLLVFPIIYIVRMRSGLLDMTSTEIFEGFLVDVGRYLTVYFVIINLIYIVLLVMALMESRKQVILAKIKKSSTLFKHRLLPSISVIAPAYNEEKSIVESVNSLLNVQYPNAEVIVVNDGSKDETLQMLKKSFNLTIKHPFFSVKLSTQPIKAVYVSQSIPNLIVIDKVNGGKADALNVGINAAKNEYVCGIDADSVLENDALLKIASPTFDETKPTIALGGNIFPANGFTFDRGIVATRDIGREAITRFQTIEYLRAFTSGRIGWSKMQSLMIISGAFGVFDRQRLIESGGYLTSSGMYKKDTVGEDMELVVRMRRQAYEEKRPHSAKYVYNAYCYTELPSDYSTLFKQRNRWQRGLIDILSYHRQIMLKRRYNHMGMIGHPYFFVFEFLGPFIEIQGYAMLVVALWLGLLNPPLILAIFTASIGFGIIVSLASIFMIEHERILLSKKAMAVLVLFAILENFGYRQMISLQRTKSTLSALRESGQWGAQKRKGFKS